jgi:hypothetical protein
MKFSSVSSCFVTLIAALPVSQASAEIVQTAAHVFDGRPYLWVEGENFSTLNGPAGGTWTIATKGGPDMSVVTAGTSVPIVPTTSNVSGAAIWAPVNDFSTAHSRTAIYELKFITAGTYQFFLRQSLYDSNNNNSFLNEDSIFLPPEFNKNSGFDWVGFQGLSFDENDVTVDIPNPGDSLDPDGWKPQAGDHERDGLLELANWGIKDDGVWVAHTPSGTLSANGNFNWYNRPAYQGTTQPANTFDGFFGMKNEFIVKPEMVGQTVTFELGLREVNVAIDGMLFIQTSNIYPDMDLLDIYSQAEVDAAILPQPVEGDYNGNGTVDAADYVLWRKDPGAFGGDPAGYNTWRTNFGRASGAGANLTAVPEPTSIGLLLLCLAPLTMARRGRDR